MSAVYRSTFRHAPCSIKAALLLLGMTTALSLPAQTITTVAGTGVNSFNGDNALATTKALNRPTGMVTDRAGNLFIADNSNQRVRRVDSSTLFMTTYVGNGLGFNAGDNGPANEASIRFPKDVAIDPNGNLYITSYDQPRIRKVTPDGTITTFAGTGTVGDEGDGGQAIVATFNNPAGLAFDRAGNLFVADYTNRRIRRIGTDGIVQTVAGGGGGGDGSAATGATLNNPQGITLDARNNLYIADATGHRIRKVSAGADGVISGAADEIITTVAGTGIPSFSGDNGTARDATLNGPTDVAVDNLGVLYIADQNNNRIRKIDPSTGIITTFAGTGEAAFGGDNGPATAAKLNQPESLSFNSAGDLLIADTENGRIRKIAGVAFFATLKIDKVANVIVPAITTASTTAPDVHLSADVDPIQVPVEISGTNLPDGTTIRLLRNGVQAASGPMTGGKVTLTLDLPVNPETGPPAVTLLQAAATVHLTLAALDALPRVKGVTLVAMEITASIGSPSKIEYLSRDGKRYSLSTLKAMEKGERNG